MRSLLTLFAVFALVFAIGCGTDDKADGCGDGCGPAKVDKTPPAKTDGDTPPAKTDGDTPPAKTDGGDAAKTITYKCSVCPKTKTGPAGTAPS